MPSSSELVPTRAGSRPAFRSASICSLAWRDMEPWWARMGVTVAPAALKPRCWATPSRVIIALHPSSARPEASAASCSFSRSAVRSARRRLLQKISVVRCCLIKSSMGGMIKGQMEPPCRSRKSSTTVTTLRSRGFSYPASTMVTRRGR